MSNYYCTCDWNDGGMFEFVSMTCSRCGRPHPLAEMFAEERKALRERVKELEAANKYLQDDLSMAYAENECLRQVDNGDKADLSKAYDTIKELEAEIAKLKAQEKERWEIAAHVRRCTGRYDGNL
jgi:DNA repair exonuclease SbcCD ATPase subunit